MSSSRYLAAYIPSGSVIALPDAASLTVTTSAPSSELSDRFVIPGAASLVVSTEVITIAVELLLPVGSADLTLTGEVPNIRAASLMYPGSASVTVTSAAPVAVDNTIISPDAATITLDESATNAVQNELPSPGSATSTITGYQVTLQRLFSANTGSGALAITGAAPSLLESVGTIMQPAAAALAIAGQAPAVGLGSVPIPASTALTASGVVPALRLDLVCGPGAGALSVAGSAPAMAQVTNVVRQPDSVYVRPNGFISGSWTPSGAPTVYEAVDEVKPDDADYMFGTGAELLRLPAIADPGFDTGHTVKARAWCPTGSGWLALALSKSDGTDIGGGAIIAEVPPTPIDISFTLSPEEVATIANYGDLALSFYQIVSGPVYVSWAALEISGVTEALSVNPESPSVAVTDLVIVEPAPASLSIAGQPVAIGQQHRPSPASAVLVASATAPVAAHGAQVAAGSVEVAGEAPVVEVGTVLRITGSAPSIGSAVAVGLNADARVVVAVGAVFGCSPAVCGGADIRI